MYGEKNTNKSKEDLPEKSRMVPVEIPYDSRVSSVRISFPARNPLILQLESQTRFSYRASANQMKNNPFKQLCNENGPPLHPVSIEHFSPIRSVSFPYRFRIISVSFSYRSPIILLSFSYHSPIVLLSFSYHSPINLLSRSGNDTETIRDEAEDVRMRFGESRMANQPCLPADRLYAR